MKLKKRNLWTPLPSGNLLQMMTISLFIILLAFFILLNSIAVLNDQKVVAAIGSLLGSFGQKSGGYSIIDGTGENEQLVPLTTDTGRIDFSDLVADNPALSQAIQVLTDPRGSLLRIPSDALFDNLETTITSSGYTLLDSIVKALANHQYPVEISCHTDNTPIVAAGGMANLEISAMRALRILQYITETGRIDIDRMTAFGRGGHQPAYSNRTLQTRKLNNRIDILFVHKLKKQKPKGGFIFKDFFFPSFE